MTCLVSTFLQLQGLSYEVRNWTKFSSGNSVAGTYLSQDDSNVTLKIRNQSYSLKKTDLCLSDREYLTNIKQEESKPRKAHFEQHLEESCEKGVWYSYLPPSYDPNEEESPVCFIFGASGKVKKLIDNFKPASDELGWVLVGIEAYSNKRVKEGDGITAIIKDCEIIYKIALKKFHIDQDKVVFSGSSGGGWWSFRSSRTYAKDTAGIISQGGWMNNEHDYRYPRNMAVAMVNGKKDEGAIRYEIPDGEFLSKKYKATVKVFRFDGGHMPSPPKSLLEAAKWVHATKEF
ncbi:hypothetical protein [Rubritalea sp.]|uniref:hypothetical protein n=1 Tax=Rubritalea sp. TaxID=2109375 RepID=UPI003EF65139